MVIRQLDPSSFLLELIKHCSLKLEYLFIDKSNVNGMRILCP